MSSGGGGLEPHTVYNFYGVLNVPLSGFAPVEESADGGFAVRGDSEFEVIGESECEYLFAVLVFKEVSKFDVRVA